MARIRSIKQDFFLNEDLATVSSDARLLAIGLSTVADRSGRLEDRPLKIKAQLFPYHDVDVKLLLDELDQNGIGFIERYSISGKHYIQITNFEKHQKPHPREPDSSIPPPKAVKENGEAVNLHGSAVKSRASEACTETNTEGSSARNGLGDLGDLGTSGNGALDPGTGSGDSVGTGASATEPDVSKRDFNIWTLGVGKLMAANQMEEQEARSFLGKQCRVFSNDVVSEAITKMLARNPVDPKAYLVGVLQGRAGPQHRKSRVDESLDAIQRGIAEREARRDAISG